MSRRVRSAAQEAEHMMNEIRNMDADQIYDTYGIEIDENGIVYDPIYDMDFDNLARWIQYNREQDETEYDEKFEHGKFDDEDV